MGLEHIEKTGEVAGFVDCCREGERFSRRSRFRLKVLGSARLRVAHPNQLVGVVTGVQRYTCVFVHIPKLLMSLLCLPN